MQRLEVLSTNFQLSIQVVFYISSAFNCHCRNTLYYYYCNYVSLKVLYMTFRGSRCTSMCEILNITFNKMFWSLSKSFHVLNCCKSSKEHNRFSRFSVFHPWLSRSFPFELATHALSRRTVHAVAAWYGWCTLLVGVGCQFAVKRLTRRPRQSSESTVAVCLVVWTSASRFTQSRPKARRDTKPVCKLYGNLALVQL